MSTYLYGAFDRIFLSCYVGVFGKSTLYICLHANGLLIEIGAISEVSKYLK